MSGDWRRLHQFAGFPVVHQKPLGSFVDPQSQDRRTEDGAAAVPEWFTRKPLGSFVVSVVVRERYFRLSVASI
jgi:hypothetical protein